VTSANTSIRLIELADAPAIAEHLARDAKATSRWDPARPAEFYTAEGQVKRIELLLDQHRGGLTWPGVIVSGGVVIGQVTVTAILRGPFQKGFVGYWVATTAQNQGHASRAVALTLQVMTEELGLHRAEAFAQAENIPSNIVLEKNGFTKWGLARSHTYIAGAWRDEVFWEQTLTTEAPAS
jgi:[ribosomal protein S5]-alanine N-acetyltransferase